MQTPVPEDLRARLEQDYPEHAAHILAALDTAPSVSLRLNPSRTPPTRPHAELYDVAIPWLPDNLEGYWLSERPLFALDPLWHAGTYYVQDASAMTLATIWDLLNLRTPHLALDLCAAPGGKSTLLRDLLPDTTLLISNEILPKRCKILVENMVKWCGADQTIITQEEPQRLTPLLQGACDLILVDAPCSGEGLMRRDEEARRMWSPQLVSDCAERQRDILREAVSMLAPEGVLLYATCTLNQEENDQIVQWLLAHYPFELVDLSSCATRAERQQEIKGTSRCEHDRLDETGDVMGQKIRACDEESSLTSVTETEVQMRHNDSLLCNGHITGAYATEYGLHLWPGIVRGEGQYIAALRLTDTSEGPSTPHKAKSLTHTPQQDIANLSWLDLSSSADYYTLGDSIYQISLEAAQLLSQAYRLRLSVATPGLAVASMRNQAKGYEPSFAFTHHRLFDPTKLSTLELSYEEALRYLRGEALTALSSPLTERGITTITYRSIPLGVAHYTGSRLNNLYPKPYRLRI